MDIPKVRRWHKRIPTQTETFDDFQKFLELQKHFFFLKSVLRLKLKITETPETYEDSIAHSNTSRRKWVKMDENGFQRVKQMKSGKTGKNGENG